MISIILPALNEAPAEIEATIRSIRDTSTRSIDVILVDDCSSTPLPPCGADKVIHNKFRAGGGAARHVGACHAKYDYLVFADAHCRFAPGWNAMLGNVPPTSKELLCGQMLALDETHDDLNKHLGVYCGASLCVADPEELHHRRILSAKWRIKPIQDGGELSAVMGSCYGIQKDFFFRIGGMRLLQGFGCEEETLSMKTILAGGSIRFEESFKVGHKFRSKTKPPYKIDVASLYYNTMTVAYTCCPPVVADELVSRLGLNVDIQRAKDAIRQNWSSIATEAAYLEQKVFKLSWQHYLERLKIIDG